MHIILLKFTDKKQNAPQHLSGHKSWLARGLEDGVFLAAGTLGANLGGVILARGGAPAEIEKRVQEDPFVRENIVSAEVIQFTPSVARDDFQFLLEMEVGE